MTEHDQGDVTELPDEKLCDEVETLARHEEEDVLTEEQEAYLRDLREELLKRASTGGPHATYTGSES